MKALKIILLLVFISSFINLCSQPNPPLTKLYLCSSQSYAVGYGYIVTGNNLIETQCRGIIRTLYLYPSRDSVDSQQGAAFGYTLNSDIPGGSYEIAIDFSIISEEEKSENVKVGLSIVLISGESETVIASEDVEINS